MAMVGGQNGRIMAANKAYVDDIVVKSKKSDHLGAVLEETFAQLQANNFKLNPEKCVFGVPRGMLLGFIVCERGIESNSKKTMAITTMAPIQYLKGVQRIMGCLATLSHFFAPWRADLHFIDS